MSNTAHSSFCAHCYTPCDKYCSVCGTDYCSEKCQREDWPYHRALCRSSVTTFSSDSRPSQNHCRGIFVGVTSKAPRFIWWNINRVPWDFFQTNQHDVGVSICRDKNFDVNMSASGVLIICKFDRNGVYPVNKFVQSLGPPSYMYPWSGGILALKWDTPATKNLRGGLRKPMKMESWLDMTPADSCRMLDSFRWNGKNAALYELERLRNMYPQWPTVDGVKINCICDYAVRPKFENVTVSLLPCDGIDCEPCKLLGLPIVYRRVTPGSVTTSGDGRAKSRAQVEQRGRMWNTNAAFLQMKLLGGDSQPLDFQRQTGNMVIFRTDKKSLSIGQVEAIVAFMESLVGDKIRAYERAPFVTKMLAIRTTYVEGMMKEKFLAFLTRFNVGLQKRVGEVVGSPYE